MPRLIAFIARIPAWLYELTLRPRLVALALAICVTVTIGLFVAAMSVRRHGLELSAGDPRGHRYLIAQHLRHEAERRKVDIELRPSSGSEQAVERVAVGELDLALVQGGLDFPAPVREVAALVPEPLHLLVKRAHEIDSLHELRGVSVNVSTSGSGTNTLARQVLAQAGIAESEVRLMTLSYDELRERETHDLPTAIFIVSALPSSLVEELVQDHGFELLDIPFAAAMALEHPGYREGLIPAYAYSGDPPVPAQDVHTVATRMLLVAHEETSEKAVRRLVEAVSSERFVRAARLPRIDEELLLRQPELELHRGSYEYLHRHDRFLTPETIDNMESLRSFFVSLVVALFLLWRWWRARRILGFEAFIAEVTALEKEVLDLESEAALDLPELWQLRRKLSSIKSRGLEEFGEGRVGSSELLTAFLMHVNDVRLHLDTLILHARERLEKKARRQGEVADEDAILQQLWSGALGEGE